MLPQYFFIEEYTESVVYLLKEHKRANFLDLRTLSPSCICLHKNELIFLTYVRMFIYSLVYFPKNPVPAVQAWSTGRNALSTLQQQHYYEYG